MNEIMNEYRDSRRGDWWQKVTGKDMEIKERIGEKEYKAVSNSTNCSHLLSAS